jgi:hypothetical protein
MGLSLASSPPEIGGGGGERGHLALIFPSHSEERADRRGARGEVHFSPEIEAIAEL